VLESYLAVYCLFNKANGLKKAEIFVIQLLRVRVVLMMSQVFWGMMLAVVAALVVVVVVVVVVVL
jgi:hypothetical protein